MKKIISFYLISCTTSSVAQNDAALNSLLHTELMFARTSKEKGIRDAFLTFVANDGIIFRPGPVNGRKWFLEHSPPDGILTWYPTFGEVSLAGDLGFTTGPWEFRNGKDSGVTAQGQFVTVWERQDDGVWRFVLDIGISHRPPVESEDTLRASLNIPSAPLPRIDLTEERANLLAQEREFSRLSLRAGFATVWSEYFLSDSRILRMNSYPITGLDSVAAFFSAEENTIQWEPTDGRVASSGDLAYTHGAYSKRSSSSPTNKKEEGNYLRIWKKIRLGWKVGLDLFQPIAR